MVLVGFCMPASITSTMAIIIELKIFYAVQMSKILEFFFYDGFGMNLKCANKQIILRKHATREHIKTLRI